jgi:LysM repeat protein
MRIQTLIIGIITAGAVIVASPQISHAQEQTENNQPEQKIVKVEPGNTLSGIAKDHQTTYVRIFDANTQIEHPDKIFPGQDIRIPSPEEQLASRQVSAPAPTPQPAKTVKATPKASTPKRASAPQAAAPSDAGVDGGVWDRLAQCESGGNWSINTGNGYYGGLQFSLSSWRAVGGQGYPHQASKAEQIARAEALKARQGWGAWPACTKKMGLR